MRLFISLYGRRPKEKIMSSNRITAKEAANLARMAAKKADEIYKSAELKAAVASEAANILRTAEEAFKKVTERLETTEEAIRKAAEGLSDQRSTNSALPALKGLAEQLQAAEATVKNAAKELQDAVAGQATEDGVNRGADTEARATEDETRKAAEELKAAKARKRAAKELRAAGNAKALSACSQAAEHLKATAAKADKALGKLQVGNGAKATDISSRMAADLEAIERDVHKAAVMVKTAATVVRRVADAAQSRLKWPKFEVWKAASKKIAEQAKIADENAKPAKTLAEATKSATDKKTSESADKYCAAANETKNKARKEYDSTMITEVILKVEGFFSEHKQHIYDRLEECDKIANKAQSNPDMLFIAESLPIINGIIHVGSARAELNSATEWVRKHWDVGEAHPRIVLSALLFHYVMDSGVRDHENCDLSKKREAWERIKKRVEKLL
jgi:hypothetical protein